MGTPSARPAGRAQEGVSAPPRAPSLPRPAPRPQHGEQGTARPDLRPLRSGDKSISGATRPQPAPGRGRADIAPPPPPQPVLRGDQVEPWSPPQPLCPKKHRARGPRRFHPVTPILVRGDGHYSDLGPGKDGVSAGPGESLGQQPLVLSPTPPRRQFGSGLAPGVPCLPQHGHFLEPGLWLCQPGREVPRNHQRSGAEAVPPVARASLFSSQDRPQL